MTMGEHTVVKGGTIVLHCNVSGTPPLSILWNHVKSGKTWQNVENTGVMPVTNMEEK